jgi:hypothetical protein
MSVPGWYADPAGDYEWRWWNGAEWSQSVATGKYTTTSPLGSPLPEAESTVWEHGRHRFTTHAVHLGKVNVTLPWWSITKVYVQVSAAQSVIATGDLVLVVGYPGYVGPSEYRIRGVSDLHQVHAMAYRWASRRRREVGYT